MAGKKAQRREERLQRALAREAAQLEELQRQRRAQRADAEPVLRAPRVLRSPLLTVLSLSLGLGGFSRFPR